MDRLEEITYEAGRAALADQEALVSGIRQRTGPLLAGQALVASFLGAPAITQQRFDTWSWMAVLALVVGLVLAAAVLAPWPLPFSVDARDLYHALYEQAPQATLGWLAAAAFVHQDLVAQNRTKVLIISCLSAALGVALVAQTVLWLLAMGVD